MEAVFIRALENGGPLLSMAVLTIYTLVTVWNRRSNGNVTSLLTALETRIGVKIDALACETTANKLALQNLQLALGPIERERAAIDQRRVITEAVRAVLAEVAPAGVPRRKKESP